MAGDINRVTIVGRLTRDPELAHLPSGTAVLKLGVAVNGRQKDEGGNWIDKPNFFDVKVFGNQADALNNHLAKGRRVGVDGRLDWSSWEAQDGTQALEGGDRRPVRAVPRQSRETPGAAAVTASASSSRPQQPPATRTSRPPLRQTTTFRSDAAARRRREARQGPAAGPQAPGPVVRPDPPEVVLLLQGQGRRDRLQEREPATPVHLGTGQDPLAAYQRSLPAASAASGSRRQART